MLLLIFLCLLSTELTASAPQINTSGDLTAVYGGEAHYRCTMDVPKDVLQVTWQRLFGDESKENLASYSNRFGQQINNPHRGKVIFTEASLSSTSITVKNLTWEDESCYICYFNIFPAGSTSKQTCLKVQGISRVHTTHVTNRDNEVMLSCSATGKPAPTIQWEFTAGATRVQEAQTSTVANSDQTFTSSSNITLRIPPDWNGHVDCLLNSGMMGERLERIPFTENRTRDWDTEDPQPLSSVAAPVVIVLLFIFSIAVAAVAVRQTRLKKKRRHRDVAQEEGFNFTQAS